MKKAKVASVTLPTEKTSTRSKLSDSIVMIYGAPGVGKTMFVNGLAPRVFFISTDRGTRSYKALRADCDSYTDLINILDSLEVNKQKLNYDIVCMDHIDDIAQYVEMHVCEELGVDSLADAGFGKGWKMYRSAMHRVVLRLKELGLGVVFIAHETIKTVRSRLREVERIMPDMSKSAWKVIIPLAEIVGYASIRSVKIGGEVKDKRILQCQPTDLLYAKDRSTRRKPTGEPGYESLDPEKFRQTFEKE